MTTAQAVEMSVTNNSLSKDYPHPDDHAEQITDTPGFKPFTMIVSLVEVMVVNMLVGVGWDWEFVILPRALVKPQNLHILLFSASYQQRGRCKEAAVRWHWNEGKSCGQQRESHSRLRVRTLEHFVIQHEDGNHSKLIYIKPIIYLNYFTFQRLKSFVTPE